MTSNIKPDTFTVKVTIRIPDQPDYEYSQHLTGRCSFSTSHNYICAVWQTRRLQEISGDIFIVARTS